MADQELSLKITLENGEFKVAANETVESIKKINDSSADTSGGINSLVSGFKAFIALEIFKKIVDIGKSFLEAADAVNKDKIAFETLTGSTEKATKAMLDVKSISDQGVFSKMGVSDVAKQLITFGTSVDQLKPTLETLANLAQGNQGKFEALGFAYSKAAAKGQVSFRELNAFILNGVPIVDALAKHMGITGQQALAMAKQGSIGFKDLNAAMKDLTTGGGAFAGNMAKYGTTSEAAFNRLNSALTGMKAKFGAELEGPIIELTNGLADLAGNADVVKGIVSFFKAAIAPIKLLFDYMLGAINLAKEAYDWASGKLTQNAGKAAVAGALRGVKEGPNKGVNTTALDSGAPSGKESRYTADNFNAAFGSVGEGAFSKIDKEYNEQRAKFNEFKKNLHDDSIKWDLVDQKIEEDHQSKKAQVIASAAQQELSFASQQISSLQNIFQMQDQMEQQRFEQKKQMIDALMDYEIQRQYEKAGILEDTASMAASKELIRLQAQYSKTASLTKKKDLDEQIEKKTQEKKKADIDEAAANKKHMLDLWLDLIKHQMMVKEFNRNKQLQLSQAGIAMAGGALAAFAGAQIYPPPASWIIGAIGAAAVIAMGAYSMAEIAAQQPPMLAEGGFITGTPTGTTITAGERGRAEAILPLEDQQAMQKIRDGLGGEGGGTTIHVHGNVYDHVGFSRVLKESLGAANVRLQHKGAY